MARGRKDKKKKDKPETPESSTQSSAPSVTDDTKQLLPEARGATSSHQSRNRRKSKSVASEPSTSSSTPPSSELSVVADDVSLLQSGARASSKDSKKTVAGTGSPRTGLKNILSRSSPESTRGKNRLAVPDQGSGGSRTPSLSPSKSPSALSQFKKSIATKFSPKKSPKRSIGSESQKESASMQKTEIADTKQKSLKETSSNTSEATLKGDVQNTGSSNSSGSSGRVSTDVLQSENRLTVPGSKSTASSQRSPKKNFLAQLKDKISPERSKREVHSDDTSKSSSKSESSSSATSHTPKKRQESNASNISTENSRSSNSKSSSISCGDNKEYLRPEMMHSGDAVENTNNGSELSTDMRNEEMRFLVKGNLLAVRPYLFTDRMDNIFFEGESRQRSRSDSSEIYLQQREPHLSKDDSKTRQEDSGDQETTKGATADCSVQPVGNQSPRIGASEIGVDIKGATANWSDQSVRRKDAATHGGANAPRGEGRSDQSIGKKITAAAWNADAPSGEGRSVQSVRKKNTAAWSADAPTGEDRSDQSVRKKNTAAWRSADAPSGEGRSDQSVRKKNTAAWSADAPTGEDRSDQSVGKKNKAAWLSVDAPIGVESDRSDKSVGGKDKTQKIGNDGPRAEKTKRSYKDSIMDFFAKIWQPRNSPLIQSDQASRPRSAVTRHRSWSPKCKHKYVHTSDCSATTKLTERRIRERRNQRKCKQPKHFNDTFDVIGNERTAVRENHNNLRGILRNLLSLEEEREKIISNLKWSIAEIVNFPPCLESTAEYSSLLMKVLDYIMRLRKMIKEMMENSNFSRLDVINQNIAILDKKTDDFLALINPNRLPGSNFAPLEEARENWTSLKMQLEEIRNNVDFSRLEYVSEDLSSIHTEILEIQQTVNVPSLVPVLHNLWNLWHILQNILEKINPPS